MQPGIREQAEALFHAGNRLLEQGRLADAEASFRQASELAPDFGEALTNLAFVLDHRGDQVAAEASYRRALQTGADYFELHMNLGVLLATQRRLAEAESCYIDALRCNPDSSAIWSNLGALYLGLKAEQEAESCLHKALELDPGNARAQFNLGYLCLRQGRFEEGWRWLESRDWYAALAQHFTFARWSGESLLGRSLVIGYEAGHGDMIQFARYVPLLKARGAARITLVCHPALKGLLQTLEGVDTVLALDEDVPRTGWDYWTPLLSIPYHLRTRADSIPDQLPYLSADSALLQQWAPRLPGGTVRVGLVWKGNPNFENDAERSLPDVRLLAPLWTVSGASLVSLQKGAGEDQLAHLGAALPIVDLGSHMASFADAAAIVSMLDLVICVDTAMAHLAGALGKPCWVLLPHYMTDWRWLAHGTQSAWYPSVMRLFRQNEGGGWPQVVEEVTDALDLMVRARQAFH